MLVLPSSSQSPYYFSSMLISRLRRCQLRNPGFSPCFHRSSFTTSLPSDYLGSCFDGKMCHGEFCVASLRQNSETPTERKRKVVEHISLLKAKEDLTNDEEKDMLDYLYTTQYHMSGIVAISLGRTSNRNPQNFTHVVYMRFQKKEDLARFYENPSYLKVLQERVTPLCHELKYVDFESEVPDDILPIFRKGEEFNYGVEFVLLVAFYADVLSRTAEEALTSLEKLTTEFPNLIVQHTQGCNLNPSSMEFTHGIVIRFRSVEALELFLDSPEYKSMWKSKFQAIVEKALPIHFTVEPVGNELM